MRRAYFAGAFLLFALVVSSWDPDTYERFRDGMVPEGIARIIGAGLALWWLWALVMWLVFRRYEKRGPPQEWYFPYVIGVAFAGMLLALSYVGGHPGVLGG